MVVINRGEHQRTSVTTKQRKI